MLKILHTADWHLGHRLHGVSRKYEHEIFLNWLLEQIEERNADALIIAGDIFDSANPPASAQSIFYDFLVKARNCSQTLDIIIIGGNHDSAARLDAPSQLFQSLGIHVVGGLTWLDNRTIDWQRMIVPITDKQGEIQAICGVMPFIRNADLPQMTSEECGDLNDPLIQGVAELYKLLLDQMQEYKMKYQLSNSIGQILTGHCYMVGTEISELSERRILGGNQHALPSNIFDKSINYVALGHLHKAQKVNHSHKETIIRYSGSPIPLSFTERNYKHQVSQIILNTDSCLTGDELIKTGNHVDVEEIIIPRAIAIQSIPERGYIKLNELEEKIKSYDFESDQNEKNKLSSPLLEIKVQLDKPEPDLRQQIETILEGLNVRLLKVSIHYPGKNEALADNIPQTRLEELHPEEVFKKCYQRNFEQKLPDKMMTLFQQLLESVEESQ
ncbi:MAG: exonuclease SbcCD subunit D C-terminal domain-containing protein [Gammaproteobacteria bacterium]|nr:exonuclease SbcCD subunit D C-terminal domain-containing protein [Gammaproteobacteria bacterium]